MNQVKLTPEARALLERMVQERDQAAHRLDVAVLAMRAALGVPLDWQLRDLEEGFIEVQNDGSNH